MTYIHTPEIHNLKAAKEIVPILIETFDPKSVIDIGCGIGTWLKIFEEFGVKDLLGIDDPSINMDNLTISPEKILKINLENRLSINRKFDLLLCLEVAEHISSLRAESFIKEISELSDIIIFSAAIPGQGGQNHLNEQYPEYWREFFHDNNFQAYDIVRPLIWNNSKVDWWYRQGIVVYIKNGDPITISKGYKASEHVYPIISKELYEEKLNDSLILSNSIENITKGKKSMKFYLKVLLNFIISRSLKFKKSKQVRIG